MATDDDGMTSSSVLCGVSPCREDNDESSVDIYDGLDNGPVVSADLATKATLTGGSLNLFDEILIAEGTAKEASYNDLQARHEKCLQQLQELMKKVNEIQEQNSILQNENQSLKKNISALLKTARVEINRKDEEISNLQRRLLAFPVHQNAYSRTSFAAPINNARNFEGLKKNNKCKDLLPENNPKTDPRTKPPPPKDIPCSYLSCDTGNLKFHSEKSNTPYVPRSHSELLHDDAHSRLTNVSNSSVKEKEKKEIRTENRHSKENDCRYKTKGHQNMGGVADAKLRVNPEKTVRNGLWKDSKNSQLKSSHYSEQRTDTFHSASEKQPTPNDRLPSKMEYSGNNRSEKSQNIKQKDLKTQNKDESCSRQKAKPSERNLEQQRRRADHISSPPEKNTSDQKLSRSYVEDKKVKDSGNRKSKRTDNHESQGRRLLSPPPPTSNSKHKHSHYKEESSKHEFENMHSKSERHRTEEKRKNKSVTLGENKNSQIERTDSKEVSQKTAKCLNKVKDCTSIEESKSFPSQETSKIADGLEKEKATKIRSDENQSKNKDLKLSFMQKLNLTLSPAKKQTSDLKQVGQPTNECDGGIPSVLVGDSATKQKSLPSVPILDSPVPANLKQVVSVSENKTDKGTESLPEILGTESSKVTSDMQNTVPCELVDKLPETNIETGKAEKTLKVPNMRSPLNQDTLPGNNFSDLEIINSVDFDSFSVIDEISGTDSDSVMEMEDTGNCEDEIVVEHPGKEKPLPKLLPQDMEEENKILSSDVSVPDQKSCNLKLSCLDQGNHLEMLCNKEVNSVSLARDANPVSVDDDNSVLSIDLNHMRCIPKAISPLNSPIRPLAKALRMESTYIGPVQSYNIDSMPESAAVCPARNMYRERNKENKKPFCADLQVLEIESQLSTSSDELEEGEIVSDDDHLKSERNAENSKKSRGKASSERSNLINSPHNQNPKTISSNEDKEKLASGRNNKEKPRTGNMMPSKETKRKKAVKIDCLDKVIAEPSMHEFILMLKAIRKQVRKNYMKFKVQFPIQQFHRIIDSAISNFTSLVKYLNFSKMSKSGQALKLNLCEVIESKLKQIKRNSAVDHLFEQRRSDMKKKLWKLVDEQLDNLFDKIKKILLNLCNLINVSNENDGKLNKRVKESPKHFILRKKDRQKPSLNVRTQKAEECALPKPVVGNHLSKRSHYNTNKMDAKKIIVTKCTNSHTDNVKGSQIVVELVKEKSIEVTELALKTGKCEKEKSQLDGSSHKSDISCGPLTEQQMSGLTFNLVNDAQMGEMFKSLLQGSDFSEKNVDFMDDNQWEFRTPEKHLLGGQNCGNDTVYEAEESFPKEPRIESRVLDGIKWPVVSPERDSTFLARLPMPVDPDILDENCMFDIPSSPALKKSEPCILEKPKSLVSSILLEDLAVSLTIPSPLKSDAHLSFLKPDMFGSVPEDVLSAHFSEDAHLEEEDASEQDIHLALESDNSNSKSSCSSSWTSMPAAPGFQYCPSLPMQAVIMEKSNDHFIVKIRRALPSASPPFDQVSLANDSLTSFIERGPNESVSEEKLDTLNCKGLPLEGMAVSKKQKDITDSEDKMHSNIEKEHVSNSLEPVKGLSVCHENHQVPDLSESLKESNPSAPDNILKSVEDLLTSARQEQDCDISEPLHELPSHTSQSQCQGTDLLELHQVSHSGACPEEASDLPDPPKEVEKSSFSVSLTELSAKTCHSEDLPNVFKLPQTHSLKVLQKREVFCATAEQLPISSAVVPLVDQFSSENHFDVCIDLTNESPMENEVDSWDLTAESTLNIGMGSFHKEELEPVGHCVADDLLKCDVGVVTDLTAKHAEKLTVGENFEGKTTFNLDSPIPDKESKKRKREVEETSSIKRQRKESNELLCKKNDKSSKKSKESMSAAKNSSSKKALSVRDKDPLSSTPSVSPLSLNAKNIIKKKGEVIISWTRNDDREILLECQKNGPSGKTFSSVAARLNKSSNQVEERFKQLVKLFNMSNCS